MSRMDPLWYALSQLRRGKYEQCVAACDEILAANPGDQAAWMCKCRAVIKQNFIDDIELDEEGVAEMLMDENALAAMPRPGTSLNKPQTAAKSGSYDPMVRPVSQSGRPVTGFARPSSSRPIGTGNVRDALQSSRRTGTARPMTTLGREVRLGTASLASSGALVDVERLNVKKYAGKLGIAMVLVDYLLYVEHNVRKALELCAEGTKQSEYKSWWWKARLGKCYFKLGLFRDAEQQLRSSLKMQPVINTYLDLCNVYLRLDLPNTALDLLTEGSEKFTCEPRFLLGLARIHDQLRDPEAAIGYYKKVLVLDASCVESIACLGAHAFYSDQPEMAIRYYRRLLQMGVSNTEVWNNLGLCCFYSAQYDMALGCFDKALGMADDESMADVWYNIGHIGISLGDLGLAYQAFKVAVSIDATHGEALNNIAVLEMRRQKFEVAKACLSTSCDVSPHIFEPFYNSALMSYRMGDFQDSYTLSCKALALNPSHGDSQELQGLLQKTFLSS
ncbi:hypothetical protein B484DRAFT_445830 [Ochromonadaceae sp. CCMP2298]|nr:hypothetical protein B484DRAFT_445830 [Ochromonadaceae sp. CCMP2298]